MVRKSISFTQTSVGSEIRTERPHRARPDTHAAPRIKNNLIDVRNVLAAHDDFSHSLDGRAGALNQTFTIESHTHSPKDASAGELSGCTVIELHPRKVGTHGDAKTIDGCAESAEAARIVEFFWEHIVPAPDKPPVPRKWGLDQLATWRREPEQPATTPTAPAPTWMGHMELHLQQAAHALALRGLHREQVEKNLAALIGDYRSHNLTRCATRGAGRDGLLFATASVITEAAGFLCAQILPASALTKYAIAGFSGFSIIFFNTIGTTLFETFFPRTDSKIARTTPAPGLESLNAELHSPAREIFLSCASLAVFYGGVRNVARWVIERSFPHLVDEPYGGIVHAALEVPFAAIGVCIRFMNDHFRMSEANVAKLALLQKNLADLIEGRAAQNEYTTSLVSSIFTNLSRNFCSATTFVLEVILGLTLIAATYADELAVRSHASDDERAIIKMIILLVAYAAIGGVVGTSAIASRNRDISTARFRYRTGDENAQANTAPTAQPIELSRRPGEKVSVFSLDSGIHDAYGELPFIPEVDYDSPSDDGIGTASQSSGCASLSPPDSPLAPATPAWHLASSMRISRMTSPPDAPAGAPSPPPECLCYP